MSSKTHYLVSKKHTDIKINVKLELNGATSDISSLTFKVGETYQLPNDVNSTADIPNITYGDNLFIGWYKDSEFTQPVFNDDPVDQNIKTLYAKWEEYNELSNTCYEVTVNSLEDGYNEVNICSIKYPKHNNPTQEYKDPGYHVENNKTFGVIDWGDGKSVKIYPEIESTWMNSQNIFLQKYANNVYGPQLSHKYKKVGKYNIRFSSNSLIIQPQLYKGQNPVLEQNIKNGRVITGVKSFANINCSVFAYLSNLTYIPNSAPNFCDFQISQMFCGCENLSDFSILSCESFKNVTTINNHAFYKCKYFTGDIYPPNIISYGSGNAQAIFQESGLSTLKFLRPDANISNTQYLFKNCLDLTSLDSLPVRKDLGKYHNFENCSNLSSVNLIRFTELSTTGWIGHTENNQNGMGNFQRCWVGKLQLPSCLTCLDGFHMVTVYDYGNISDLVHLKEIGKWGLIPALYHRYPKMTLDLSRCSALTGIYIASLAASRDLEKLILPAQPLSIDVGSISNINYQGALNGLTYCSCIECLSEHPPTLLNYFGQTFGSERYQGVNWVKLANLFTGNAYIYTNKSRLVVPEPDNYLTGEWKDVLCNKLCCNFRCVPKALNDARGFEISGLNLAYQLTSDIIQPTIDVYTRDYGKKLQENIDYTVKYINNDITGEASVVISGIGEYKNSYTEPFYIYNLSDCVSVDLNGEWERATMPGLSDENSNYYVFQSKSNVGVPNSIASMYIYIKNLEQLTIYITSWAEKGLDYTVARMCGWDVSAFNNINEFNIQTTSSLNLVTVPEINNITDTTIWKPTSLQVLNVRDYSLNAIISEGHEYFNKFYYPGQIFKFQILYRKDGADDENYDRGFVAIPKSAYISEINIIN